MTSVGLELTTPISRTTQIYPLNQPGTPWGHFYVFLWPRVDRGTTSTFSLLYLKLGIWGLRRKIRT